MVNLETIFFPPISDKLVRVVIIVMVAFLLIDSMINNVADFLHPETTSKWGISFFIILVIVFAISQQILLRYVIGKTKDIRSKSFLIRSLLKVVIALQYTLVGILIIIIYQILFTSKYNTNLLIWSTTISLLLAISLVGILARQFYIWYRSTKRDSFIIACYTLAFVIVSLTLSLGLLLDLYNLSSKPGIVTPNSEVSFPNYDDAGPLLLVLHYIYNYTDLVSFVLIWAATALLLLHYRRRLGLVKFWIILALPLIYYLGTFVDILGIYKPQSDLESYYYYLYLSLNSTAGGIMFGIAFMVISRRIDNQRIKGYMTLASYGFILLYISGQVSLVACPYPPFGIATLDISGLSSFLLLTGLYSTAISLSRHAELRKAIRNSIESQHSKLIDNIGMSEVQRDIEKRVSPLVHRYAAQINSQSTLDLTLSEKEVKQYIDEVLEDLYRK
jgi:hypothetical protein